MGMILEQKLNIIGRIKKVDGKWGIVVESMALNHSFGHKNKGNGRRKLSGFHTGHACGNNSALNRNRKRHEEITWREVAYI